MKEFSLKGDYKRLFPFGSSVFSKIGNFKEKVKGN